MIDEEGRGYVEVPLSYPPEAFGRGDDVARGRRLTQMGSYDSGTDTTTFVINGQTVIVNGNMAGSNMAWGLGLIDITQVNVRDAFTGMPLDESAKLRVYENGWVEVLRSTFYVGDRARFFYLAGANCDRFCSTNMCDGSLDIKYEIVFTNGFEYNNKHFSADQIGLMETTIVFFVLQMVLVLIYFVQRRELKAIHKHHHTVKLLGSSIILMMFAQGSYMLQYLWFASDGMGWLPLLFMAQILQGASETLFVLLLILIAKGWTICCRKISARGRVKIAVFGTVYAITWLAIPIYYHFFADKASTLTMYQSPWGYTLCALRIFGLGWFSYSVSVTLKKYNSKVRFYKKFVSAFSFWFISQPVIVSIAFALVPWVRSLVITAMDLTVFFLFQAAMLSMYNPNTSFNKSFPFHATTNETFAHKGNVTRMVSQRRVPGGAMGGGGPNQSFGNTAFTSGGKGGAMNDFDRHELQAALHSARVLGQEAKKILACLEQLEASNEAESDDEAYEAENGGGGGFQDGNGGGSRAETARASPRHRPRAANTETATGARARGAPGTAAVRSRAAVGTTAAMDKVRVRVRVALGTTAVRGTAAVTTVARDPPPGATAARVPARARRLPSGTTEVSARPARTPSFPPPPAPPQPPFRFSPGRRRTVCPLCRVAPLPLATSSDNARSSREWLRTIASGRDRAGTRERRRREKSRRRKRRRVSRSPCRPRDWLITPHFSIRVMSLYFIVVLHASVISASAAAAFASSPAPSSAFASSASSFFSSAGASASFAFAFPRPRPFPAPFSAALPADLPLPPAPSSPFFARLASGGLIALACVEKSNDSMDTSVYFPSSRHLSRKRWTSGLERMRLPQGE